MAAFHTQTSQSPSALPDLAPLPWLYPYREDPYSTRLGEPVFRPFVEISLANGDESTTLLGSVGFLDRWTVTASRFAQAIAIEDRDAFDERFGTVLSV